MSQSTNMQRQGSQNPQDLTKPLQELYRRDANTRAVLDYFTQLPSKHSSSGQSQAGSLTFTAASISKQAHLDQQQVSACLRQIAEITGERYDGNQISFENYIPQSIGASAATGSVPRLLEEQSKSAANT